MGKSDIETRAAIDVLMRVIGDFRESLLLGTTAYRKHGRHPLHRCRQAGLWPPCVPSTTVL